MLPVYSINTALLYGLNKRTTVHLSSRRYQLKTFMSLSYIASPYKFCAAEVLIRKRNGFLCADRSIIQKKKDAFIFRTDYKDDTL